MKYQVKRIDDPDFGCEGCPDGQIPMAKVWLQDENGEKIIVSTPDAKLYQENILEGDFVEIIRKEDEKGQKIVYLAKIG